MFTILCDVNVTRRTFLHHVLDEDDTLLYSTKSVVDAMNWLVEQGQVAFTLNGYVGNEMRLVTVKLDGPPRAPSFVNVEDTELDTTIKTE